MRLVLISLTALALTLGLAACDGDETVVDSIVRSDSTEALVMGTVILRPWTDFHLNLVKMHNEDLVIDSVRLSDSLCRLAYGAFRVWGDERSFGAYYYAPDEPARFGSGDTAHVDIFGERGAASVDVKLLDLSSDSVTLVASASDSEVPVGMEVDLVWNSVPNADWYGLTYGFWYDSGGHSYMVYDGSLATTDTTAQLPGGTRIGGYGANLEAFTGPIPGTGARNVDGNGFVGYIYSQSGSTYLNVDVVPTIIFPEGDQNRPTGYAAPEGSVLGNVLRDLGQ